MVQQSGITLIVIFPDMPHGAQVGRRVNIQMHRRVLEPGPFPSSAYVPLGPGLNCGTTRWPLPDSVTFRPGGGWDVDAAVLGRGNGSVPRNHVCGLPLIFPESSTLRH